MDEVGWEAPGAAARSRPTNPGMDSEGQARLCEPRNLIRSSLEEWSLKASVRIRARAGLRLSLSVRAKHEVTDWEVTPLLSVLFSRPRRCCRL